MAQRPGMLRGLRILAAAAFIAVALLPSSIPGFRSPEPVLAGSDGCSPSSPTCYLLDVSLAGSGFGTYATIDANGSFTGRINCHYGNETQTGTCGWGYELVPPGGGAYLAVYRVTPDPGSQVCEGNGTVCHGPGVIDDFLEFSGNYLEARWRFELISAVQIDVVVEGAGSGTVTSDPVGIDCPGDCDDLYPSGLPVTLTARPASGSVFSRWEGDCTGTDRTCVVSPEFLLTVTAVFNKKATAPPPTKQPTEEPTDEPTEEPTDEPTPEPTASAAPPTDALPTASLATLPTESPSAAAPSPTAAPSPEAAASGGTLPIVAGLAVMLVVLVGGAVFFAWRGRAPAVG